MKQIYLSAITLCLSFAVAAQAPGGIGASNFLSLWIRSDMPSTLSSTDSLNSWTYYNIPANVFTSSPHNRPIIRASSFNFFPTVFFNGVQEMDGPTGANAPITATNPSYAIFAVWSSGLVSATPQRVWSQNTTGVETGGYGDCAAVWIFNGEYGDQDDLSPFTQGLGLIENPGQIYISQIDLLAQNTSDLQLIDQTNILGSPLVLNSDPAGLSLTDRNIATTLNRLGSADVPTGEPFIGNLAELIVYNNEVDNSFVPNARNQIFSYLGMKYGVHLRISLLSSTGATVWNATTNNAYNNAVFGVALDNTSGLSVLQSNSASTGSGNGAGQSGAGNITLSIGSIGADQSFLMMGNDNGALTETTSNIPSSATGSSRLQRNWKVANTNNVGPVNLNFDFTGLTISGTVGTTTDFRLMVNSAGDPTFATGTTELYTPASFTGNVANFSSVNLPDGSVFGVISNASAGTPLPVNFISFTAASESSNVDLNWVVGNDLQAAGYEVDHSTDGLNFTRIGEVPNNPDQTSYSFTQVKVEPGKHYYRILETDENGNSIYSKIDAVTILAGGDFSVAVLNNPASGNTDPQLQINAASAGTAAIELWSAVGSRISVLQQAIGTGTTTIAVPMSHLPAGSYVVKVAVNNGTQTHVAQVVKL